MKQNHKIIKAIIKKSFSPNGLTKEEILFRWSDKFKPRHLEDDLNEMISLGIISRSNGYYQLVPTPTP